MKKNTLTTLIFAFVALVSIVTYGHRYHRPPPMHYGPRMHYAPLPPSPHHYHSHHSSWGRGGCNFWPGFLGGVAGSVIMSTLPPPPPAPVVVVPPVPTTPIVVQPTPVVVSPYTTIIRQ